MNSTQLTFGASIGGTDLVRRFHGSRELAPTFVGLIGAPTSDRFREACRQAQALGLKAFTMDGDTFIHRGEWYFLNLSSPSEPPPSASNRSHARRSSSTKSRLRKRALRDLEVTP